MDLPSIETPSIASSPVNNGLTSWPVLSSSSTLIVSDKRYVHELFDEPGLKLWASVKALMT